MPSRPASRPGEPSRSTITPTDLEATTRHEHPDVGDDRVLDDWVFQPLRPRLAAAPWRRVVGLDEEVVKADPDRPSRTFAVQRIVARNGER